MKEVELSAESLTRNEKGRVTMTDDELEQHKDGIARANRWIFAGMLLAIFNVLLAGWVWWIKP